MKKNNLMWNSVLTAILSIGLLTTLSTHSSQAADDIIYDYYVQGELTLCRAYADHEEISSETNGKPDRDNECCSKQWGFCIVCEPGKNYCVKTPHSSRIPNRIPNIPTRAGELLAPTPDKPVTTIPGTMPQLQIQQQLLLQQQLQPQRLQLQQQLQPQQQLNVR